MLMIRFILLLCLSVQTFAGIATDPFYQVVQTPAGVQWVHGTCSVISPSGTNYFIAATRGGNPCFFMRAQVGNVSNLTYFIWETNSHLNCPAICAVNHQLFAFVSTDTSTPWTNFITHIDPDTMATNDIYSSLTNNWAGCSSGGIASDGTNLYCIDGGSGIAKFSTNGALLITNTTYVSGIQNAWIGRTLHSIVWDGAHLLVTGHNSTLYGNNCVSQINPSDLTQIAIAVVPTNLNVFAAVTFTDDQSTDGHWDFINDESSASMATFGVNPAGGVVAINSGLAPFSPPSSGYGTCWDGNYDWSIWPTGWFSRFRPSDIVNGVVRVDNFTLGTNRPIFNELVSFNLNGTEIYYANDWHSATNGTKIYQFSTPDFFNTVYSFTNGQLYVPPTMFELK